MPNSTHRRRKSRERKKHYVDESRYGGAPYFTPRNDKGSDGLIPYQIQRLSSSRHCKALFLVPLYLIERLLEHPIVCRGSMFELRRDDTMVVEESCNAFLVGLQGGPPRSICVSVDFVSPFPLELTLAIAERLTTRVERTKEEHYEYQQELKKGGANYHRKGASGHPAANSPFTSMIFGM